MQPAEKLLRRVFIPIERRGLFRTTDGRAYRRNPVTNVITRVVPKVRGKKARHADKLARRQAFAAVRAAKTAA